MQSNFGTNLDVIFRSYRCDTIPYQKQYKTENVYFSLTSQGHSPLMEDEATGVDAWENCPYCILPEREQTDAYQNWTCFLHPRTFCSGIGTIHSGYFLVETSFHFS